MAGGWDTIQCATPTLDEIAIRIYYLCTSLSNLDLDGFYKEPIREGRRFAQSLQSRHNHGDPCDDLACPCREAEHEHTRDQGLSRP